VYQLWNTKNEDEKEKYRDMDFIEKLINSRIEKTKAESKGIIQSSAANQKHSRSVVSDWVRKAMIDVRYGALLAMPQLKADKTAFS
jgi:hypothetical protein